MLHLIPLTIAVAAATTQTAMTVTSPVSVTTCNATDILNPALTAEFGPPIGYHVLQLSFVNANDVDATSVTFDVAHDGTHTIVIDRGRFTKGARIDRIIDGGDAGGRPGASCDVASATYADGSAWTRAGGATNGAATVRGTTFHPDDEKALTVDQMTRAWQAEIDRLMPPVLTGGG